MNVRHLLTGLCVAACVTLGPGVAAIADGAPAPTEEAPVVSADTTAPSDTTATAPVDTTATAPVDTTATTPVDTTATTPVDTTATTTAPAETTRTEDARPDRLVVQDVQIESVQISTADTGNNHSASDVPAVASPSAPATDLATGTASSTGSADGTTIQQHVVTQLADDATANVVQISIVFNIGVGVANSGHNELASSSAAAGSGTITTGSATAIGNDAATYVTQGASGRAGPGEEHTVEQQTATLQIGFSKANTGLNVINATIGIGGPGTTGTGNATAIGNLASTGITQLVDARGTGTADLYVEQRATVINFGLAVADTGFNQVGADLGAALNGGDQGVLEQLLALLLPSLVASVSTPPAGGSGGISTGDALAIGNRSTTEVLQTAFGASDSGSVDIRQQVTVVNAGAATATTGRNVMGSSDALRNSATPEAQAVAGQLTTFLHSLVLDINSWISGSITGLDSRSMATSFGDFDIGIERTLAAQSGSSVGSSVTTRQLAAVVNLAIARANSGVNHVSTGTSDAPIITRLEDVAAARTLAAAGMDAVLVVGGTDPLLIVTGDASATNMSVLVVCQRADLADLECLAPPAATPTVPPTGSDQVTDTGPATASDPGVPTVVVEPVAQVSATPAHVEGVARPAGDERRLPATGSDPLGLIVTALLLSMLGSMLLVTSRRPA